VGNIERPIRMLQDGVRSMLLHANLPGALWAEALHTAVYCRNRVLLVTLGGVTATPYEHLTGTRPDLTTSSQVGRKYFRPEGRFSRVLT